MRMVGVCFVLAALAAGGPCRADPSLVGVPLVTSSHGQPFCTDKAQLVGLLRAQVSEARFPIGAFNTCSYVPDNALVAVGADLSPRTRYMHVVRARASLLLGAVEGYTWSVGLYPPH